MTIAVKKSIWYREPFVWLVILFPLTAVVAGFITLYLAIESNDGLVVDDYYERGQHINQTLERDDAARAAGLHAELALDYAGRAMTLSLGANKRETLPAQIRVRWLNATRAGHDQEITVVRGADGRYRAALPSLIEGHWYLQIEAQDWRLVGSLQVPETRTLALNPRGTLAAR